MGALDEIIQGIPGYDPVATVGDCHFDEKAAQLALDFFPECLKHVKGHLAGKPFRLEPWQQSIIANLFGWKRADNTRRYRKAFIFLPRKNGKTTLAAGIAVLVLFCDGEPGAEIYSAATDRLQATLVFDQAAGMIRQQPLLRDRCVIYGGGPAGQSKTVALNDYSGSYKVLSGDSKTKDGLNTHLAVIDEVHAFPDRTLVDVIATSTGSRTQPLIVMITTADYARESICNEELGRARQVRDGIIADETLLPVIYEGSLEDDWTSPVVWQRVNPNVGVSVFADYLRQECQKAQELPSYENTFKRLHLNITTEQASRWLPMEVWTACGAVVDEEALEGKACWAGLDLAATTDIAAFLMWFPELRDVLARFWVPAESAYRRERRDGVPYEAWAKQGWITLTEGNVIDHDAIRAGINADGKRFDIREIGIDRWNSTQLQTQLMGDGFEVIPFGQGFASMSAPTKELEKLVISGQLKHGDNPVLTWMASNVCVETDAAGNLKPSKKKSTEKIDGIVALIMAIGRAMVRQEKPKSVYETRGLRRVFD